MLNFDFSFTKNSRAVNSLSLGHLIVVGSEKTISSKDKYPSQAFMVLPSITYLLDDIRTLVGLRVGNEFCFTGLDSSFALIFRRKSTDVIEVIYDQQIISISQVSDLVASIWKAVKTILNNYNMSVASESNPNNGNSPGEDAVIIDLTAAMKQFEDAFRLEV